MPPFITIKELPLRQTHMILKPLIHRIKCSIIVKSLASNSDAKFMWIPSTVVQLSSTAKDSLGSREQVYLLLTCLIIPSAHTYNIFRHQQLPRPLSLFIVPFICRQYFFYSVLMDHYFLQRSLRCVLPSCQHDGLIIYDTTWAQYTNKSFKYV